MARYRPDAGGRLNGGSHASQVSSLTAPRIAPDRRLLRRTHGTGHHPREDRECHVRAAPQAIAQGATIADWPDSTGRMATLRAGTNGWTCLPSQPKTEYVTNNAICADPNFTEMLKAMFGGRPPALKGVGYAYMLSNETWESNTDVHSLAPAADNQWHHVGSHVMVVYPDKAALAGLPVMPVPTVRTSCGRARRTRMSCGR